MPAPRTPDKSIAVFIIWMDRSLKGLMDGPAAVRPWCGSFLRRDEWIGPEDIHAPQ
jgi:hypothetical protein